VSKPCYYSTLEVNKNCSEEDLKKSYRKLASKFHPDKNPNDPKAEEKFKSINEAYETLRDSEKRAAYDRFGHAGNVGNARRERGFNPFDIFSQEFGFGGGNFDPFSHFFGGARHNSRQPTSQPGETIQHNIQITMEEAFHGVEKEFTYAVYDKCEQCSGTGNLNASTETQACTTCGGQGRVGIQNGPFHIVQDCFACGGSGRNSSANCQSCEGQGRSRKHKNIKVAIPKGIGDGAILKMSNAGCIGVRGGPTGDLLLTVRILQNNIFKREGMDLIYACEVPFYNCILGTRILVNRFGEDIDIDIPPLTQTNAVINVPNKGMCNSKECGNLQLHILTKLPVTITEEQKNCLFKFNEQ